MNLTLEQIFGVGAIQDASTLTIQKSSLQGLTPGSNTAESLLAAIIATAYQPFYGFLTDENDNFVTSETGEQIDYDNTKLYDVLNVEFWRNDFDSNKAIFTFLVHQFTVYTG